ncbi:DivIVA domain-containing protein [Micromonospora sp. LOL_024]|uniref:DivIVA domain-containing protein n=1 Tax=Micromonospora sp. LOL_024 TaxID=3345412 RepID=UPI003A889BB5
MASQGQRFRRKALRRGYKVDEVDAFLDRVEATLAGQPVGAPVASQEVHDVVFRVRFNGYDEWQVDLHLDRVERQLAELEERGVAAGRGDSRMGPPDRMGPGMREDRGMSPVPQPPVPPRPMPAQGGPYGRYDEPTGAFAGGYDAPRGGYDGPRGAAGPMGPGGPMGHPGGPPPRGLPAGPGGYGPPEGPGGYGPPEGPGGYGPPAGPGGYGPPEGPGGYGPPDGQRFDGFEAGRHGRTDMTAEMRLPDRDPRRGPAGPPPSLPQQALGGPSMGGPPPMAGPPAMGGPPMAGPPGSDLYRVDQIRRSFQVRRFGSGYDPDQVDRFFESLLGGMAGRNQMPVNPKDLDTLRFGLVQGGYFEAEVDAALKNAQDILFGR